MTHPHLCQQNTERTRYAGLTPSTWRFCRFAANQKLQHFTLGAEGSGTVAAVGPGVTNLKVIDAPLYMPDADLIQPGQQCLL